MTKEVTLRELARLYARGTIDRNSYHKSRAELLKGIMEGRIKVKDIKQTSRQDKAVSRTEGGGESDISATEIRPEMPVTGAERHRPDSNKRLLLLFIGIGAAILAILITLVVLLLQNSLT